MNGLVASVVFALTLPAAGPSSRVPFRPKAKPAAQGLDPVGHWAFVHVTTAISDAPLLGKLTTETRAVGLADLERDGAKLQLTETVCSLRTSSPTPFVKTTYPPSFQRAVSGNVRRARVEEASGQRWFVLPRAWTAQGARLQDVARDPLPADANDDRLYDADGDGAPGLTVRVDGMVGGEIRVVTRGWTSARVPLRSADLIEGPLAWFTDQSVVDVTNRLLAHQPTTAPHPDTRRSWFRMIRLRAGATCKDLGALPGGWKTRAPEL